MLNTSIAGPSLFRVAETDFDTIRANLKDFLRNQSEFTDYDFDGPGLAVLLDLLAYNTHYMAMNLNLIGNESFIDSAQLRASLLSRAKDLNYTPNSKTAATANVNITVTPGASEDNTVTTLILPRYTRFLSNPVAGKTFNFVTTSANTAFQANGAFSYSNVSIRQGDVITQQYTVDQNNPKRRFLLPTANVDINTIQVVVQESSANTLTSTYILADDVTLIDSNTKVYFLEENPDANGTYSLFFGDGVIGKLLGNNNIVITTYLDTFGPDANKAATFTAIEGVGAYSANVSVDTVVAAYGGSEKESVEQIRFRAPRWYNTQNRAVTIDDYKLLLPKDYPNILSVNVWGGEDNNPPIYGKIFISILPVENYEFTLLEKQRIIDQIIAERAMLTVIPEIIEPDYTYLLLQIIVNYDSSLTTNTAEEIQALARAAVIDYRDDHLRKFNSTFRESVLHRYIDAAHEAITGSQITIYLQKRFEPDLELPKNYTLDFAIPLFKAGSINKMYSYPEVTLQDLNGVTRTALIEEVPDSFTGVDSVSVLTQGSGYTETPTVTITGDGSGATAVAILENGKVKSITIGQRGSNYSRAFATITGGGNGSGASARVNLQARNGTIRTYYFNTNTGEKVIIDNTAGTIDYDAGIITLSSFQPITLVSNQRYDDETLTINIQPNEETIPSVTNEILTIDEDDVGSILVTMIAE